jgi:hypothetical protein
MARASRVPLGRMRGDPDVSRESSASHQNGSRRTPLRGSRSSAPLIGRNTHMYFWNIASLKKDLNSRPLSQLDSLKYFLVLSFLGMIPLPKPPYFSEGNLVYFTFGAATLILGTIYAYFKNGGSQGQDFISRYVSLSWVMAVRVLPYIIIFGGLLSFGLLSKLQENTQKTLSLIIVYSFSIFYYWRVGHHMAEVASGKPQTINHRVE